MEIGSQITVVIIKIDLECATKSERAREQRNNDWFVRGLPKSKPNALAVVAWIVWVAAIAHTVRRWRRRWLRWSWR